ncbi:hypothetical protein SGLAM104S_04916 [Streptomyces glaucescens]
MGVVEIADLGAQRPGVHGLADQVGDAQAEGGGGQFPVRAEAGEQDDGDAPGLLEAAPTAHHPEVVVTGQVRVEQQEADLPAQRPFQCLVAAGR